ncbi:MAG: cache domain-containing protein, partial [Comamonadaceae bacterium]
VARSRDELGAMVTALGRLARTLSAVVADVRGNAAFVTHEGTYRAFGGNPAKVGTRVQDVAGVDGSGLLQTIINQAKHEPGWVEYDFTNPTTGKVQTKMSYVQGVDDLYLGCGVYKNLVHAS